MEQVERNWVEFVVQPPASRKGSYVSINEKGRIAINRAVWTELRCPRQVSLLYDEAHLTIGVRPASAVTPNTFAVVAVNTEERRFWIRGLDFVRQAKLDIPYCVRFLDPHIEHDTLILDLNHTARVAGPRSRAN